MQDISYPPAGLVIWACEGTKRCHNVVEVVNEEEGIIKLFLNYLDTLNINKTRLRARVQCNAEDVENEQKRWSVITGIPLIQFIKPIVKHSDRKIIRKSNSVIVRYNSKEVKDYLYKTARESGLLK